MKLITSFAFKALRMGPLPYLGLCVAVVGIGALLQLRGGPGAGFADGRTMFGTFAQIGGCIGLFGLLTLVFQGLPPEGQPGMDVPHSARAARMDGADPGARPARKGAQPASGAAAGLGSAGTSAARTATRLTRQLGLQAIRQLAARKG